MNKKNNLGKISIPFSLLSIFLVSCGKNTSIPEATYQKSKASFNLNVAPSANYEAQPDAQTIIIPESGCVILNSFANINNIKKQLTFDNINLYPSALENFRLNVKDQSLCHTTTLIPNKTDLAELVLKIGDEVSETFNIKVQSYPLPPIILNSFTKEVKNNIYNFSVNINNKNQPLNPKLYQIKFLSKDQKTVAFVSDEFFDIRDYNNDKIGTIRNLDDGTTQFTINNSFDHHQIHSIVIGHKFSVVANRYIINTEEQSLDRVNTDSFFTNEISTRESLINNKIKELFNAQIQNISEEFDNLSKQVKDLYTEKDEFHRKSKQIKDNITELTKIINSTEGVNTLITRLHEILESDSLKTTEIKKLEQAKISLETQLSALNNNINSFILAKTKFFADTLEETSSNTEIFNPVIAALNNLSKDTIKTNLKVIAEKLDSLIINNNGLNEDEINDAKVINEDIKELNEIINPT